MDEKEYGFYEINARMETPQFLTYHWVLEVPRGLYKEVLAGYGKDIYTEEPVQEFVTQYLRWKGDNGIVGLVGIDAQENIVVIDAAVRYPSFE
jgi:hypothetical protein